MAERAQEVSSVVVNQNRIGSLPVSFQQLFDGARGKRIPYFHMYGHPYCQPYVVAYSQEEFNTLSWISEQVDQIYWKVLRFAQRHLPDPFFINQLGIHPFLIPAARLEVPFHGVTRQDWIVNKQGMKIIENNTDTPTGIPEVAYLAESILTEFTNLTNPSKNMDSLIVQGFKQLIQFYREQGHTGLIAFSCYDWHEEDRCNTQYLMDLAQLIAEPIIFAPIEQLEVIADVGLFYEGKKIDIWYRLYPLEYLVHDQDQDGFETGPAILSLIEKGKLAIINPAQSIITQSKGFMALIWSMYERNDSLRFLNDSPFFTEEECSIINTYFLPTYFTKARFKDTRIPYVTKALFGREGKGTNLVDEQGQVEPVEWEIETDEEAATRAYYQEQPQIYQKQFPMEKVASPDRHGELQGYLLTGVFVIGGSYAGIMPRIGGRITGNLASFCSAGIKRKEE